MDHREADYGAWWHLAADGHDRPRGVIVHIQHDIGAHGGRGNHHSHHPECDKGPRQLVHEILPVPEADAPGTRPTTRTADVVQSTTCFMTSLPRGFSASPAGRRADGARPRPS